MNSGPPTFRRYVEVGRSRLEVSECDEQLARAIAILWDSAVTRRLDSFVAQASIVMELSAVPSALAEALARAEAAGLEVAISAALRAGGATLELVHPCGTRTRRTIPAAH